MLKTAGLTTLLAIGIMIDVAAADGPSPEKPMVRALRIAREMRLDGSLTDPLWRDAQPVELGFEIMPGENVSAPQKTVVKIAYDGERLYIGFDCRDTNMSELRAHISDRDKIFNDDFALVILDTYGDNQHSYEFFINPYGIQGDILRSGSSEDESYDAIWHSAAAVNDSGWTAEMAIPFKSLRFPPTGDQTWGIMLGRNFPRTSRAIFSWTPVDRNNPCLTCQGGVLTGIQGVEATNSFELLPYILSSHTGALRDEDDYTKGFQTEGLTARAGGGLRYSPTPDFSLDAVINPDFSQVESDAQQVSVNTTSALFYPERRPFFTQGMEVFRSTSQNNGFNSIQVFYTRSINNPLAAAKVAGKAGNWSLAYLAAADRNSTYIVPWEEGSEPVESEIRSFSNIARGKYQFGNESYIGLTVVTKNSSGAHNSLAGIDWSYLFGGNYYLRGEAFASDTREVNDPSLFDDSSVVFRGHTATLDGEEFAGLYGKVSLQRSARDYSFTVSYMDASPTFQAHNGYVASNNYRFITLDQNYSIYPNNGTVDMANFQISTGLHYNHDGSLKERWIVPGVFAQMAGQTNIFAGYMLVNDELYQGVQFNNMHRGLLFMNAQPLSSIGFRFEGQFGRFIYRDNPSLGTGHELSAGVTLRPTSQFQFEFGYTRARLSDVATGSLYYDGNITRGVAIYQFTPQLFLRLIGQYNSFDEPTMNIFPLLSYKLNPFTIFYAGITHESQRYTGTGVYTTNARQYFLKFQYLFRS